MGDTLGDAFAIVAAIPYCPTLDVISDEIVESAGKIFHLNIPSDKVTDNFPASRR